MGKSARRRTARDHSADGSKMVAPVVPDQSGEVAEKIDQPVPVPEKRPIAAPTPAQCWNCGGTHLRVTYTRVLAEHGKREVNVQCQNPTCLAPGFYYEPIERKS